MSIKDSVLKLRNKISSNKIVYLGFPILIISVLAFVFHMLFGGSSNNVVTEKQTVVSTNIPTADEELFSSDKEDEFTYDDVDNGYGDGSPEGEYITEMSDSIFIREADIVDVDLGKKEKARVVMKNQERLRDLIQNMNENKKRRSERIADKKAERERERMRKERMYRRQDSLERAHEMKQREHEMKMAQIIANGSATPNNTAVANMNNGSMDLITESPNSSVPTSTTPVIVDQSNESFNSVSKAKSSKLYMVEVYGDYKGLISGSNLKLRVLEDISKDNLGVKRNAIVFGRLKVTKQRIDITIENVVDRKIKEVDFQVYDYDGSRGVNVPTNIQNDMLKRLEKQAGRGVFVELPLVGRVGTNIFTQKSVIKVDIPNAYKLYLK